MKIKITIEEIRKYLDIETPDFPNYVAPLINLANQYDNGKEVSFYLLSKTLQTEGLQRAI